MRKVKEYVFDVAKELNENIKQTGQLVVGLIDATAQNQVNMNNYYNSLAAKTKSGMSPHLSRDMIFPSSYTSYSN